MILVKWGSNYLPLINNEVIGDGWSVQDITLDEVFDWIYRP